MYVHSRVYVDTHNFRDFTRTIMLFNFTTPAYFVNYCSNIPNFSYFFSTNFHEQKKGARKLPITSSSVQHCLCILIVIEEAILNTISIVNALHPATPLVGWGLEGRISESHRNLMYCKYRLPSFSLMRSPNNLKLCFFS